MAAVFSQENVPKRCMVDDFTTVFGKEGIKRGQDFHFAFRLWVKPRQ